MTKKSEIGQLGEDLACECLKKQGYKIIERNFRRPWGEIDIICQDPDKTLVFVEVKAIRQFGKLTANNSAEFVNSASGRTENSANELMPEDQLTKSKFQKLAKTASMYVGQNEKLIKNDKGWRIDLLALTLRESSGSVLSRAEGLTINGKSVDVSHYKNI